MVQDQIDTEDAFLAPIWTLTAAVAVGVSEVTLFGTSFSDTAISLAGSDWSFALLVGLGVFAAAYVTNDADLGSVGQQYRIAAIAGPVLLLGLTYIQQVKDFFANGSDIFAILFIALQALAYFVVSYRA
jgi:hypothetical protein